MPFHISIQKLMEIKFYLLITMCMKCRATNYKKNMTGKCFFRWKFKFLINTDEMRLQNDFFSLLLIANEIMQSFFCALQSQFKANAGVNKHETRSEGGKWENSIIWMENCFKIFSSIHSLLMKSLKNSSLSWKNSNWVFSS